MIPVTCWNCDLSFEAHPLYAGKKIPCPGCGSANQIASGASAPVAEPFDFASAKHRPPESPPIVSRRRRAQGARAPVLSWIIGACAVAGFIAVAGIMVTGGKPARPAASPAKADAQTQAKRLEIIHELQASGVLGKVNGREMWVGPAFYAAKFDDKEKIALLVCYWAFELPADHALGLGDPSLELIDDRSGKTVGHFGWAYGGLKMD